MKTQAITAAAVGGELFADIAQVMPSPLNRARAEYAAAKAAFDAADEHEDESGEPMPQEIKRELRDAQRRLEKEEAYALQQSKWNGL